jgi:hypothetical protein
MHDCKGMAKVKLQIEIPIEASFNGNYRSGVEELEDCAVEHLLSYFPVDWHIEILDVDIKDYEHTTAEREVDNED